MIKFTTQENLISFINAGFIKLSHKDARFIRNLNYLNKLQKPITSNQVVLFEKLVMKYQRQLKKHNYDLTYLKSLPWGSEIIDSLPEYTNVFLFLENGKLFLKCPFNKRFINALTGANVNPFKWDKEEKRYEALFSVYALKLAVDLTSKHYSVINYCSKIENIINRFLKYDDSLVWEPTLKCVNGLYLIGAANSNLLESIKDINLNDNISNIANLVEYGIKLDAQFTQNEKNNFAGSFIYETELNNLDSVLEWLKELNCDCIFCYGLTNGSFKQQFLKKIKDSNIDYYNHTDLLFSDILKRKFQSYNFAVSIQFITSIKYNLALLDKYKTKKIIKVQNSTPIKIK